MSNTSTFDPAACLDGLPELSTEAIIRKAIVPVHKRTFARWLATGQFPRPDVVTAKLRFWAKETLRRWLSEQAANAAAATR